VRSQIAGNIADPTGVAIVDADGDNKLEVIEAGYGDSDRSVFTYKLGADNPQLIRNDLPGGARVIYDAIRYGVADLNGDGSREVVLGGDLYTFDPGKRYFISTTASPGSPIRPICLVGLELPTSTRRCWSRIFWPVRLEKKSLLLSAQ